jgi:peptidase E
MRTHDESSLAALFDRVDVAYCSGGNTFYLLREIRRSGFDRAIIPFLAGGGVYAGASAGALVATPEIAPAGLVDNPSAAPDLASTAGMCLTDLALCPHYRSDEPVWPEIVRRYRVDYGYEAVAMRDGDYVAIFADRRDIVRYDA